jgi:hypothetical protein
MPPKHVWTEPRDTQLRRLRHDGADWGAIAATLSMSRNAVMERARRIGARLPPPESVASAQARLLMDPSRDPLPAGHTVTWTAITAGTALAGTGYHDAGYDCPTDIASNWNKS